MKKICDYCGGKRKWESGLSMVTGEVFYTTCPLCDGLGWLEEEAPSIDKATEEEKRKLAEKHMMENIQRESNLKIIRDAIRLNPNAFLKK